MECELRARTELSRVVGGPGGDEIAISVRETQEEDREDFQEFQKVLSVLCSKCYFPVSLRSSATSPLSPKMLQNGFTWGRGICQK